MENNYIELQDEQNTVYVNAKTRHLFRQMLNETCEDILLGKDRIKYGECLYQIKRDVFESLFNQWVTKCQDAGYMYIKNDNSSEKYLAWSNDLNDVQRALKGMEVLKEIL